MPGYDTMIQSAVDRRNLPALFAALPLLKDLDADSIGHLANEIAWFSVPGGAPLYSSGEAADCLYVIVNGAFGIYADQPGGGSRYIETLSAGQIAGDMEIFAGKARSTTLVALRDSEVARLSSTTFEKLIAMHPQALRHIARRLAEQVGALQQTQRRPASAPKTFALVPIDSSLDARLLGSELVTCLRRFGRAELVLSTHATERTTHWFHRLERANDFVVYVTDPEPSHWSRLCMRQADVLLLAADAYSKPRAWLALNSMDDGSAEMRASEILLVHRSGRASCAAREWLTGQKCRRLHHVHGMEDVARATRLMTGRSVGLVLSGGGARGFAHIGVLRAVKEAKIAVDAIGATSIGAVIGAGWAAGWDYQEMLERMRRSFVVSNPLSDYTLPIISLVAGRKASRLMRQEFGELDIEDLRLPYYCVSANLTNGELAIHRKGKLWMWLRASIAIPGVLPPVFTQRQAYVDGATLNNLPVDIMREDFQGPIIAVDAGADRTFTSDLEMTEIPALWGLRRLFERGRSQVNIMKILLRAGMLNSATTSIHQRELADVLLRPPLEKVDLLDWRAFERTIDIGYRYAVRALESHDRLLQPAASLAG
ncbi:MAG TPA: patatin-like phospholipase family protein [Steroidobacteraceae bacterium]|nr:patatin-like phospholipase family protein [Steroidobacteraceae bacterium]